MESGSVASRLSGSQWRLWALVPVAALVGAVALFVSTGGSLLELVTPTLSGAPSIQS